MSEVEGEEFEEEEEEIEISKYPDKDTLRILIVTDSHLGHSERDSIRRYDSFRAFDEALSIGRQYEVDFVLHGGDLFHQNKPSRFCMLKTIQILRKHCLGDKPIHFQVVSDQSRNFANGNVNFQDPNVNIALPIFMIHGNHDDPSGLGNHAAIEELSASNLINYFGRCDDLENLEVFPVLLKKGETRVALYGLGHIRDERLHRAFLHQKVKFIKPKSSKSWFNIAIVHQNRTNRGQQYKDFLPEAFLPKMLDVVYWAHEHECLIDLNESLSGQFFVTQPGSTIPTSLSQYESKPKYVGILEIRGDECRLVPVKIKTARPFLWDEVELEPHFEPDVEIEDIENFLVDKVKHLITRAENEFPPPSQQEDQHLSMITDFSETKEDFSRLPIIRLRVDHSGFPKLRPSSFGQHFAKSVANPEEILLFHRKGVRKATTKSQSDRPDLLDLGLNLGDVEQAEPIQDIVEETLIKANDPLTIFPESELLDSVQLFVDKEETHAIAEYCRKSIQQLQTRLINDKVLGESEQIAAAANRTTSQRRDHLRNQRQLRKIQEEKDARSAAAVDIEMNENNSKIAPKQSKKKSLKAKRKFNPKESVSDDDVDNDDDLELIETSPMRKQKPKKRKGRLPTLLHSNNRSNKKQSASAATKPSQMIIDSDDDDDLDLTGLFPTPSRSAVQSSTAPQRYPSHIMASEVSPSAHTESQSNPPSKRRRLLDGAQSVSNSFAQSDLSRFSFQNKSPKRGNNRGAALTSPPKNQSNLDESILGALLLDVDSDSDDSGNKSKSKNSRSNSKAQKANQTDSDTSKGKRRRRGTAPKNKQLGKLRARG